MKRKLTPIDFINGVEFPLDHLPAGKIITAEDFNRLIQEAFDSTALPKMEITGYEVISGFGRKAQTARVYGKISK